MEDNNMKKRKTFFRSLALCLTLLMAIGIFATTAYAQVSPNDTESIVVSGVEDGVTVSAYKLMDVKVNENGQPQEPVYTWTSEVASWVRTYYSSYIGADTDNSVQPAFNKDADDSTIATFYDALAAAIKGGSPSIMPQTATSSNKSATISDLPMGNYLILIENGMKVYRPSAVNLVPVWEDDEWVLNTAAVTVKASEPTITKTVKAPGTTTGKEKDNANIGDTVTFDIVADIPQFPAKAAAKNYVISDILPTGLTLTDDSIQVLGVSTDASGSETPINGSYEKSYSRPEGAVTDTNNATTFTLTFDYAQIKTYQKVHIQYTATLNDKAVLGADGNPNTAYLDYSNNPYVATSWKTKTDSAIVYTYGLDISKVDKKNHETFLSGAEFELYASEEAAAAGTNPIKFIKLDGEGVYRRALAAERGITTLTVDSREDTKGKLTLKGLDEGTWYLKETKAPDSYNLLASPVAVAITDVKDGVLDGNVIVGDTEQSTGLVPLTVENDNGFQLPVTGGIGTIMFTAVGMVLMCAAIVLIVVAFKVKKSAANAQNR